MAKKRLIKIALKQVKDKKPKVEKLVDHLKGMVALLFSNDNPFSLYQFLEKNKSPAPAKPGQIAPKDIVVKAGKTNFAPGPIISELAKFGIKTQVEGGKLAIKEDVVVAKEGEEISAPLAQMLTRLGLEPMEIGLNITAMYEDGNILTKDVLAIDEEQYIQDFTQAHRWAFNLAVEAGIFTAETTEFVLVKAVRDARGLALEAGIYAKDTMDELLGKAHHIANGVKASLNV